MAVHGKLDIAGHSIRDAEFPNPLQRPSHLKDFAAAPRLFDTHRSDFSRSSVEATYFGKPSLTLAAEKTEGHDKTNKAGLRTLGPELSDL